MNAGGKLYFGGVPTGPDVKKIESALGETPSPGLVTYAQLAEITGIQPKTSRFRSVLDAWRRRLMRERNIDTESEPGEGVRILRPGERVDVTGKHLRFATRKAVRVQNRAAAIPVAELDDLQRRRHDHLLRQANLFGQAGLEANANFRKALRAPEQVLKLKQAADGEA